MPFFAQRKHWENQTQFLQARHRHTQAETIVVGIDGERGDFELLSWTVSMAARPRDAVVAFFFKSPDTSEDHGISASSLKILKDLCELKQVQLDIRPACGSNGDDSGVIKMSKSLLASMLVVRLSRSNRSKMREARKRGNSLVQKVPPGCAVVVVNDSKMLFYKESASDAEEGPYKVTPRHKGINGSVRYYRSLSRQFSCRSSPLWIEEEYEREDNEDEDEDEDDENDEKEQVEGGEEEDYLDQSLKAVAGRRIWPVQTGEGINSAGDFDCLLMPQESEMLTFGCKGHNILQKSLLSCIFVENDCRTLSKGRSKIQTNLWKDGLIRRLSTFPPTNQLKRFSPGRASLRTPASMSNTGILGPHDQALELPPDVLQNCKCFSYEELDAATDHFSQENMVGKGGHAEVYKGVMRDGKVVAVKRLAKATSEEIRVQDFLTELGIVAHVSHPNATSLVGFCVEENLYLIFEFSSNGSLATLLYGVNAPVLDWSSRYKVAVGTARGIHYLHTACPRRIIHRDIKASNILLDVDFEPQISDFGLAKWLPDQRSQLSVVPVEGTFGYLAPEYFMYGIIHEKTDVFAYGVLLLELITGRQPIDNTKQSLVIWAKPMLESMKIEELVDQRLAGQYDNREIQIMVKAANLCIQPSPICRPHMSQILEMLTEKHFEPQSVPSRSCLIDDSNDEYSSSNYLRDLCRHREIALQF